MYGGASFPDENFILKHDAPGLLSMVSFIIVGVLKVDLDWRIETSSNSFHHFAKDLHDIHFINPCLFVFGLVRWLKKCHTTDIICPTITQEIVLVILHTAAVNRSFLTKVYSNLYFYY